MVDISAVFSAFEEPEASDPERLPLEYLPLGTHRGKAANAGAAGTRLGDVLREHRAKEAEDWWRELCWRSLEAIEEGEERGLRGAMVTIDYCPEGKAMSFSVWPPFYRCLEEVISQVESYADSALDVLVQHPFDLRFGRQPTTEESIRAARRFIDKAIYYALFLLYAFGEGHDADKERLRDRFVMTSTMHESLIVNTIADLNCLCEQLEADMDRADDALLREASLLEQRLRELGVSEAEVDEAELERIIAEMEVGVVS